MEDCCTPRDRMSGERFVQKKRLILVFKKEQLESGFIAELRGFKHEGVVDDWFFRLVGIFIDK